MRSIAAAAAVITLPGRGLLLEAPLVGQRPTASGASTPGVASCRSEAARSAAGRAMRKLAASRRI
jgi:hypothetical protein